MTLGSAPQLAGAERRRAVAWGIAILVAYAVLAAWSGWLTPLARGPLLDGLAPVNYRWVSPPAELEATNQEPTSGRFVLPLGEEGTGTQVVFTSDSQVTVIVDDGSIGPASGERSAVLLVDPVDPALLQPPGSGLVAFGNAYELRARFRPSNDPIRSLDGPIQVLLAYPSTATLHANTHELLYSPDGEVWEPLETTDSPAQQQAETDVPGLGYVVVAGVPASQPAGRPDAASSTPPLAVALLVAAGVVLMIGLALLVRSRADRSAGDDHPR